MRTEFVPYYVYAGLEKRSQLEVSGCKRDRVIEVICKFNKVDFQEIISKSRKREVTKARQLLCHFLYEKTNMNLIKIGEFINRDHSTVIYNKDVVKDLCFSDKSYKEQFLLMEKLI